MNTVAISAALQAVSGVSYQAYISWFPGGASVTVFDWSGDERGVLTGKLGFSRSRSLNPPQPPSPPPHAYIQGARIQVLLAI